MEFNLNGHGTYQMTPSSPNHGEDILLSPLSSKQAAIKLSNNDGYGTNQTLFTKDQRTWSHDPSQVQSAFHMAGLFLEKSFHELRARYKFVRSEFSVMLIVGDLDGDNTQYCSTYHPVKTQKNPHYSDEMTFPVRNYMQMDSETQQDSYRSTLLMAMHAVENFAHNKAVPQSHKITEPQLKYV